MKRKHPFLKTASVDDLDAMQKAMNATNTLAELAVAAANCPVSATYSTNSTGSLGTTFQGANLNQNGRLYPPLGTGNGFVIPQPIAIPLGGGSYTVSNTVFNSPNDVRKELESLCLNIEKYDALEGTLKKMAQEFLEAIDKNTTLSGKNLLVYNTLRTHDVLIDKERFETIRKLQALTEE